MTHFNPTPDLTGKTVIITRAINQQSEARKSLQAAGARVLDLPALEIVPPDNWGPLDDALLDFDSFHWIIFSSVNGVQAVEERLNLKNSSLLHRPRSLKIAAVGRKTADFLQKLEVKVDFVPPKYLADSLIKHFPVSGWGLKMLIPRVQSGGRNILAEAFGNSGAKVVEVAAYESRCPIDFPGITAQALAKKEVDIIAFTSGKTAKHTAQLMQNYFGLNWNKELEGVKLVSIGPQTSITCMKYFYRVDQEANPHDLEGLVVACVRSISG